MERSAVMFHFPTVVSCWSWLSSRRPRITARRVGVVVATVAVLVVAVLVAEHRGDRFRALAANHGERVAAMLTDATGYHSGHENDEVHYYHAEGKEFTNREMALLKWHAKLRKKYLDASLRPWLPVAPDPLRP